MAVARADLLGVLHAYVPAELAENLLRRALGRCGVEGASIADDQIDRVVDAVAIGINLFIEPSLRSSANAELRRLVGAATETYLARVEVATEADVLRARAAGRTIALRLGARSLIAQRVSNVINELSRAVIEYAERGHLEVRGVRTEPRVTIVSAGDFAHRLDELRAEIDSDEPHGWGMGLSAVRRCVDRFGVVSDGRSVRIEAHVFV
jgi:serine/threonine-protein kinase RsbT